MGLGEGTSAEASERRVGTLAGILEVRQLFAYQEERFGQHLQKLVEKLQDVLSWPDGREIELERELERLGADRAPQDSPTPSPTNVEDGALQDDP
jgi:hypothetical protein